jgi:hypothetical protein
MTSSYIGRSLHEIFESCLYKIAEIETSVSSWQKDDLIKANISAMESEACEEACAKILEITHILSDIGRALDANVSGDESRFKALQKGMKPSEWGRVLKDCHRASSPVECQLRVLLTGLGAARNNIQEVITRNAVIQAGSMAGRPALDLHNIDMDLDLDRIWEAFLTLKAAADRSDPYREVV